MTNISEETKKTKKPHKPLSSREVSHGASDLTSRNLTKKLGGFALFAILLIALAALFFVLKEPQKLSINEKDLKTVSVKSEEKEGESTAKPGDAIMRFSVENVDSVVMPFDDHHQDQAGESEPASGEDKENPYDKVIEEGQFINPGENVVHALRLYRSYLNNATNLLVKFMQDQPYSAELVKLKEANFTEHVNLLIVKLEEYDSMNANISNEGEEILLFDSKFLSHFIKVTKKADNISARQKLKMDIIANIGDLLDYLYSLDMQEQFVK